MTRVNVETMVLLVLATVAVIVVLHRVAERTGLAGSPWAPPSRHPTRAPRSPWAASRPAPAAGHPHPGRGPAQRRDGADHAHRGGHRRPRRGVLRLVRAGPVHRGRGRRRRGGTGGRPGCPATSAGWTSLQHAQREDLIRWRNAGQLTDEGLRILERELDHEEDLLPSPRTQWTHSGSSPTRVPPAINAASGWRSSTSGSTWVPGSRRTAGMSSAASALSSSAPLSSRKPFV